MKEYYLIASIGEIFAYFKQISKLETKDIDVANTNIAKNATGLRVNDVELDNVSPILRDMK